MPQLSPMPLIIPFPLHRFWGKVSLSLAEGAPVELIILHLCWHKMVLVYGENTHWAMAIWRQGNHCGCKPEFPPPLTNREQFRVNHHGCSSPYFMYITTLQTWPSYQQGQEHLSKAQTIFQSDNDLLPNTHVNMLPLPYGQMTLLWKSGNPFQTAEPTDKR